MDTNNDIDIIYVKSVNYIWKMKKKRMSKKKTVSM